MASQHGCLTEKPLLIQDYCGESRADNRIIVGAFVKKGTAISGNTPQARSAALIAAESAGNAYIVRSINGTDDGGAIADLKGYGSEVSRPGSTTFTHTLTDPAVVTHTKFWNQMKRQAGNYEYRYFTPGYGFHTTKKLTIKPTFPKTDDITTKQEIVVTVQFAQEDAPEPVEWDTDALEALPELFDAEAIDFTAGTGTTVDPNGDITFTDDTPGTATIATGVNVSSVEIVSEADLPTGLTLTRTAQGATITGTPTTPGVTTIALLFKNTAGIGATKSVTITVAAA